MKRISLGALTLALALGGAAQAGEIDGKAVLGGALGGATGAAVGSAVGGRDGAIIGAGVGGAAGAAIATQGSKPHASTRVQTIPVQREVVYVHGDGHRHDNGLHLGHHKHKHKHKHRHHD